MQQTCFYGRKFLPPPANLYPRRNRLGVRLARYIWLPTFSLLPDVAPPLRLKMHLVSSISWRSSPNDTLSLVADAKASQPTCCDSLKNHSGNARCTRQVAARESRQPEIPKNPCFMNISEHHADHRLNWQGNNSSDRPTTISQI